MILLASSLQEIIAHWKRGTQGLVNVCSVDNLDSLREDLVRSKPTILMLDHDLPKLGGAKGVAVLTKLSPETRILILSNIISEDAEWELFKAGVRGCCQKDIDSKRIKEIVKAVQQGELWIRRSLTCRLLDELGAISSERNKIKQAASDLLLNLTQREHEIATLVGTGESNKKIANRLAITERTVKAHLTEIFRKLNIDDRLNLALMVSGSIDRSGPMQDGNNISVN